MPSAITLAPLTAGASLDMADEARHRRVVADSVLSSKRHYDSVAVLLDDRAAAGENKRRSAPPPHTRTVVGRAGSC